MKVRTDFVTNSSSSSFILARDEELSERLQKVMVEFVLNHLMGDEQLTPDSTEEQIQKFFEEEYIYEDKQEEIRRALKEGKSIYSDWVSFECCEDNYAYLYEELWKCLKEAGSEEFLIIDGDLSY